MGEKGVKVEKPLQIVNILQNDMPLMAVRRMLVILRRGAEARILPATTHRIPICNSCRCRPSRCGWDAMQFSIITILRSQPRRLRRLSSLYLRQEEGSHVLIDGITLYNGDTRNEYYCRLEGSHADLKLLGMGIEDYSRHLDSYSRIDHIAGDCHTDELFKYVVDDEAVGAFAGLIYVKPGADKTEAYQSNRNIVGSDRARMFSKPQLEIYDDDVKCSHGTAIGQLDEMQVFYMQTRGIPEETAKLLLKQAFMADVIDGVRLPWLKERLQSLWSADLPEEKPIAPRARLHAQVTRID